MFLVVHWPSERGPGIIRDLNEKTRQSQLMGFRLARLLEHVPPQSRVTLLGQSNGARIILSAVHLLHGKPLEGYPGIPDFRLSTSRADLRFRLVLLEAAVGHNWLRVGARLEGVVPASEAILNLYNHCDLALAAYPYGRYTGWRQALGASASRQTTSPGWVRWQVASRSTRFTPRSVRATFSSRKRSPCLKSWPWSRTIRDGEHSGSTPSKRRQPNRSWRFGRRNGFLNAALP